MKKIEAYTMMEVAVTMLLAAICMSICYTAYHMVEDYFQKFQQQNALAEEVLTLRRTMERDMMKGRYAIRSADGMNIPGDSLNISYRFADSTILRSAGNLRTDSFHVRPADLNFQFEGREALELDTVDYIRFMLRTEKQQSIPVTIGKLYSAHDLFQ